MRQIIRAITRAEAQNLPEAFLAQAREKQRLARLKTQSAPFAGLPKRGRQLKAQGR